ncbi:MAG: MFS transporter [Fusobacteriaceae bacterium]
MEEIKKSNFKRYFQFFLVVIGAGGIYPLIYLRTSFQTPMLQVFNMTMEQLSSMYIMLGIMFVIGYLPSGWLADRFSPRVLISFSLLMCGIIGVYFSTIPAKEYIRYVFLGWGIFSVFTFWSAILKAVKMLARHNEQARFFGILDGGRGVIEAILGTFAMTIFSSRLAGSTGDIAKTKEGLISVIYMYSIAMIVIAILVFLFLKTEKKSVEDIAIQKLESSNKNLWTDILTTLKIVEVWLVSLIIFCAYTVTWTLYYYSGYLTTNHNATSVIAGYVSVVILWMRPFGGVGGGFLGDKFGKSSFLWIATLIGSISLFIMAFIPAGSNVNLVFLMVIIASLMVYVMRGLYWSLLDDCNVPQKTLGVTIGIISFVGYLPDIIIPMWSGKIFTRYSDGPMAYSWYFIISGIIGLIGVFLIICFNKILKNKKYNSINIDIKLKK